MAWALLYIKTDKKFQIYSFEDSKFVSLRPWRCVSEVKKKVMGSYTESCNTEQGLTEPVVFYG